MVKTSLINTVILLLLLLSSGCKKNSPTEPQPTKPPGYQEDIPWPSLADSPWPMANHDPQATGRSQYIGPKNGNLDWIYQDFSQVQCGITLDKNQNLYFGNGFSDKGLYSLDMNGNLIWKATFGSIKIFTTPIITSNNNIITSDGGFYIYAFNLVGETLWRKELKIGTFLQKNLILDREGNLLLIGSNELCSISEVGIINWTYFDERFYQVRPIQLSFSPDGNTLYIPGNKQSLLSFSISTQKVQWTFGDEYSVASMVDSQGNIYVQTNSGLYSLTSSGDERWHFYAESDIGDSAPTITKSGNIYFATDTLFSLTYHGELRWKKPLGARCDAPLVCDFEENVFVEAVNENINFFSFSINGDQIWNTTTEGTFVYGSPAISENGSIIFPVYNNKIINIK